MYEELAPRLGCASYRKLPDLSVTPGSSGVKEARKKYGDMMPDWLDGTNVGRISPLGYGQDTAQIAPKEFVDQMIANSNIQVVIGKCVGLETDQGSAFDGRAV